MLTLNDVLEAREKMKKVVHQTPLEYSQTFTNLSGNEVYMKLENLQKTGSFKVRGSFNKIMTLSEAERKRGVIAASAGNHAQGVAYSSGMIGIPCTIVMPKGAPLSKVEATKGYGAEVILHGDVFDDSLEYALELQRQRGMTFVHPFDDLAVMAGQGTIGLEIIEQFPEADVVICPVGGGGLLAGVAFTLKQLKPSIEVYGVESSACPGMTAALRHKKPVVIASSDTIADGIAVKKPGNITYQYIEKYVDGVVCVEEAEISRTMLYLLERNKLLVEGSAACPLAALLYQKLPFTEKKVVAILSGGNVDVTLISRIIERGLVESGRFVTFTTVISDKPGQLNKLLRIIAELEANVMSIHQQRIGAKVLPGQAEIHFSLETKNREHIHQIHQVLLKEGYDVELFQ
ncbi:threonine ammonia-lyase [Parageobacillus thermoglucosidasius]|uniref:threonine ammonia-lyase n=2 Tax=Parageobacillus thermoglucosidasius TaxID=1426 RepID=A0AAN0YPP7_PARTM|nr:threonine ammonia-lyase [Parageobacillus thermoglucosidasius]KYD18144.1 Threonine dehydratase [Anoxybacillus flavithermus]REK53864.1 MAG: threonine ammonia-lyase [Geobacillus sp.]ALF11020.1 threonine dehydratase [Parageobacillus thermoglucosidasius]ANZ31097.1 threonine ammonia-lyase [Parageobacillus thermoglucosidasius]APM81834.1 threonine ammonia-lyase [Parageobacillus thermoglucosidasius]